MASNYLIIGQGLVGTVLSYHLLQKKINHKVMDDGHRSAATLAAAGIINPITGRRYVKSWMIDDLLPAAETTYKGFEKLLGINLVTKRNILRSLDDMAQENRWHEATSRPGYDGYVVPEPELGGYKELVDNKMSYGEITQAMQVDVGQLITHYSSFLKSRDLLIEKFFVIKDIDFHSEAITVDGEMYDKIIFCTGYKAASDSLFGNLPFQPAKGESFHVEIKEQLPDKLLRDKMFIAPITDYTFWTGGGYAWDTDNDEPTSEGRESWQEKISNLLRVDFEIVAHRAGVRPSVKGRRPLLGQHPEFDNVYLFNGMGTKGTSLAPYCAIQMINYLEEGIDLPEEIDLARFL